MLTDGHPAVQAGAGRLPVILWDVDGTLITRGDGRSDKHREAVSQVSGLPLSGDGDNEGQTDFEIISGICARHGVTPTDDAMKAMLSALDELTHAELLRLPCEATPGASVALASVETLGCVNGVLTGNTARRAQDKLGAACLGHQVDWSSAFFGGSPGSRADLVTQAIVRLHEVQPGRPVLIIGDTPRDVVAARAAGVPVVSVATGRYSLEQLEELGPDVLMPSLLDLAPLTAFILSSVNETGHVSAAATQAMSDQTPLPG